MKIRKKIFDKCRMIDRPYSSESGARMRGPNANPRTKIERQRDFSVSLWMLRSSPIFSRLGARIEDATGDMNV